MVLCHDMASMVALVMASLLPRIRRCVGNMGLKMGRGFKWGSSGGEINSFPPPHKTTQFVFGQFNFGFFEVVIDCAYVPHDSSSLIKPRVLLNWMK